MAEVLRDYRTAPLPERDKALLALIEKIALQAHQVDAGDVDAARRAGWSDEAIYDAITVCALFKFYNTWIDATGVGALPAEGYANSGKRLAADGYAPAHNEQHGGSDD